MNLKKVVKLPNDEVRVASWYYDKGISIGTYTKEDSVAKFLASVGAEGDNKTLHINKTEAEKLGFKVVII